MLLTAFLVALFLTVTLKYLDFFTLKVTLGALTVVLAVAILILDAVFATPYLASPDEVISTLCVPIDKVEALKLAIPLAFVVAY